MPKPNSLAKIKKNITAKSMRGPVPQSKGLVIPFYTMFAGKGSGTAGPPANWLTRK